MWPSNTQREIGLRRLGWSRAELQCGSVGDSCSAAPTRACALRDRSRRVRTRVVVREWQYDEAAHLGDGPRGLWRTLAHDRTRSRDMIDRGG
jgi:hypothetical protein